MELSTSALSYPHTHAHALRHLISSYMMVCIAYIACTMHPKSLTQASTLYDRMSCQSQTGGTQSQASGITAGSNRATRRSCKPSCALPACPVGCAIQCGHPCQVLLQTPAICAQHLYAICVTHAQHYAQQQDRIQLLGSSVANQQPGCVLHFTSSSQR